MKKYGTLRIIVLLLAGIVFLCISPVSAADQIAIDPVPGNLTAGSVIEITGTTTHPVGTNLQYEFFRESGDAGSVRIGTYSGAEGTITAVDGGAARIWNVPILTEGYASGNYTFRIGDGSSTGAVSVRVPLAPGTAAPAAPAAAATPTATDSLFKSPLYSSPSGTFAVKTVPDLSARQNILAKGSPLTIQVTSLAGNRAGIWITSAFPRTGYTRFQEVAADGSGNAEYRVPDTSGMNSGQYFLYVVDGKTSLEYQPDKNNSSAYISPETLEAGLNAHEQQNPYRKFMILLEEPVIQMNDLSAAPTGSPVTIGGTTNLNPGTLLSVRIFPPDPDLRDQPVLTYFAGVVAEETSGSHGTWHATVNTTGLPPGEYIVKVRNGTTESTGLQVLYDSIYAANLTPGSNLSVNAYQVDPETKMVVTASPTREAGSGASPAMLAITGIAVLAGLGVLAGCGRKR